VRFSQPRWRLAFRNVATFRLRNSYRRFGGDSRLNLEGCPRRTRLLERTEGEDSKLRRDWVIVGETTMHPIPQEPNLQCRPQVLTGEICDYVADPKSSSVLFDYIQT
jgi:hypothetical protein